MDTRHLAGGVMALLASMAVLAGCAWGTTPSPTPSQPTASAASPTVGPETSTTSPTASPLAGAASGNEYYLAGHDLMDQARWDDAAVAFTKAIALDPTHALSYAERGFAYAQVVKTDLAIADYTKAIELDPTLAWVFYRRGFVYGMLLGKFDQAIADYTRSIELDPTEPAVFFERAGAYSAQGRFDLAIADYTSVIELDPAPMAYAFRGYVRAKGGDTAGATADFDQALSLATEPNEISNIKRTRCAAGLGCE